MDDFLRKLRFFVGAAVTIGLIVGGLAWDNPNLIGAAFLTTFFTGGVGGLICAYAEPPTD